MAFALVNGLRARTGFPASRTGSGAKMGMFSSRFYYAHAFFLLLCALSCTELAHGHAVSNFSVGASAYVCNDNIICQGTAHVGQTWTNGKNDTPSFPGRLSLLLERPELSGQSAGLAFYKDPVRLLDPAKKKAASFNTSFAVTGVMEQFNDSLHRNTGDGMTFVLSGGYHGALGGAAHFLGIFGVTGLTTYQSIVVEFDTYKNPKYPTYDISHNHVSFDFQNISWRAAANASSVGVYLWWNQTVFSWVEYRAETKQLELRISYEKVRPPHPLLNYTVDLFDVSAEYMYAGFSAGSGDTWNHYYVEDWTFESYGISIPPPGRQKRTILIVTISVGVSLLLIVVVGLCILYYYSRMVPVKQWALIDPANRRDDQLQLPGTPQRVSYKHLSAATGAFGEGSKLGQGGFGSVYLGVLPASGTHVAVKKIKGDSCQGEKQFMAEISIISQLRHRNLIQLLGWCKDAPRCKYLLVYEYYPNGSLDKALFLPESVDSSSDSSSMKPLSWKQRFNIVNGTAAALTYLHHSWRQQVIHRDIKASNIMLDQEWNAKLGDFGLARLVDHLNAAPTTVVAGTYGYIAPEAASGRFTDKTDVFAFGAVCLEIACGRKAFCIHRPSDEMVLVDWVWQRLSEGRLLSVVDKHLHGQYDIYWMEVVLLIGLLCSHPNPYSRPSMRKVTQVLAGEVPTPSVPVSKPSTVFNTNIQEVSIDDLQQIKWNVEDTPPIHGLQSQRESQSSTFSEEVHRDVSFELSSDDSSNV